MKPNVLGSVIQNLQAMQREEKKGEPLLSTATVVTSGAVEALIREGDSGPLEALARKEPGLYAALRMSEPGAPKVIQDYCREEILSLTGKFPRTGICRKCGGTFTYGRRRKYCSKVCYRKASQPDDTKEARRAYRRVSAVWKRRVYESHGGRGESPEAVTAELKKSERYGPLIEKYNIALDRWEKRRD